MISANCMHTCAGQELDDTLPDNEYRDYYQPEYRLRLPEDPAMPDKNVREEMENVRNRVLQQLSACAFVQSPWCLAWCWTDANAFICAPARGPRDARQECARGDGERAQPRPAAALSVSLCAVFPAQNVLWGCCACHGWSHECLLLSAGWLQHLANVCTSVHLMPPDTTAAAAAIARAMLQQQYEP